MRKIPGRFSAILLVALTLVCKADFLSAQNKDTLFSEEPIYFPSDFFDNQNPVELNLAFNVKDLTNDKISEKTIDAVLTVNLNDSVKIKKPVKLKSRGNARRDHCFFPPYLLNFKKTDVSDDLPSDVDKIKVVTHCMNSNEYSSYIFKEYIAYKLYNIITDYSFKVRLAKITYTDTGRKNKTYTEWAFLIEPENMMAERVDALPIKLDKVTYGMSDSIQTALMSLFQYFIGNTDFSFAGRHNIKFIKFKDFKKTHLIPVPYDFDYSGLVKASYAVPTEKLFIKDVTQRYYFDICRSDETYKYVLNIFKDKKEEIFSFIQSFDFLDKKTRKYVENYLGSFYREIEKQNFIKNHIRITCIE